MNPALKSCATKKLGDHQVLIMYQVDGVDLKSGPEVTLGDLAKMGGDASSDETNVVPHDQLAALGGRYKDEVLWKSRNIKGDRTKRSSGHFNTRDIHPHIGELLEGDKAELASVWQLTDHAKSLISNADLYEKETERAKRTKKKLFLGFPKAALERLENADSQARGLFLEIKEVRLTVFATGHAFIATKISLQTQSGDVPSAIEFTEAVYASSRLNEVYWVASQTEPDKSPTKLSTIFSLGTLIRALALGKDANTARHGRVSTYSFARFNTPLQEAERKTLGTMLARHYTSDYQISDRLSGLYTVRDFETVSHTVALEGASTIVAPTEAAPELTEFLTNYKSTTVNRHYAPLVLLAHHELAFLISRTNASAATEIDQRDHDHTLSELEALHEASLIFRLFYRFSQVSRISMHNAFYQGYREAFNLDHMQDEFSGDVEAAEYHLREMRLAEHEIKENKKQRRFWFAAVLGAAALAADSVFSVSKEAATLITTDPTLISKISVGLSLAVALATFFIGVLKWPRKPTHTPVGNLSLSAMINHMTNNGQKKVQK